MHTLVRSLRLREAVLAEGPAFLVALTCAEAFFKFHSFTLECVCFLATWWALSFLLSRAIARPTCERGPRPGRV
jgi:hypothetical protein